MQVGSLVYHIEWECTGIVLRQGVSAYFIHFHHHGSDWCSECELEVISASR